MDLANLREQLFPRPRSIVAVGAGTTAATTPHEVHDPDLPAQGYALTVTAERTTLRYADEAGRRYGAATLAQLDALDGGRPLVEVHDHPDFPTRGFMLDVSRDRVPTRATLDRLVEILALARYNHLELYIEHTFEHPGHDTVWAGASPITADDLRWLEARCREDGIELVANQNTFGHMERWLRHDAYRERAEAPDGFSAAPGVTLPPAVLAPTPDNAAFALELVHNQVELLASRTVHIGCDETFELGKGRSAAEVADRGTAAVYVEHLARIAQPLLDEGRTVLFWGDIVGHDPASAAGLPDGDLIPVVWTYERPMTPDEVPKISPGLAAVLTELGIDLASMAAGFTSAAAPFAALGRPFWVAPGTSSWNSLVGRIDNARANLLDAARSGRTAGATGYLVTDWGDGGHLQAVSASYGPAIYGGAVSWCAETNHDVDLAAVLDDFVFGDRAGVLGRAVVRLGTLWNRTGQRALNGSPLQAALCSSSMFFVTGRPDAGLLAEVVAEVDSVIADLGTAAPTCVDGDLVVRELSLGAALAGHGARRLLASAGGTPFPAEDDAAALLALIAEFTAVWNLRSRPGGLDDAIGHLEAAVPAGFGVPDARRRG